MRGASELDWSLIRAATIAIALIAIHSFFDYPLRTGAMMAVIAYACALLIEPPEAVRRAEAQRRSGLVKVHRPEPKPSPAPSLRVQKPSSTSAEPAEAPQRLLTQRWGVGIEWPKEWSEPVDKPASNGDRQRVKPTEPSDS
jgi:hypothetical protein